MDDLKWIKKHFGEEMMHLCKRLFPKLLDNEGQLSQILKEHFCPDRQLAKDIIEQGLENDFADYIFSQCEMETEVEADTFKTAVKLLEEAGYILYECKTEEDIQRFKKYFAPGEELCTFRGGRLNSCRVWFAVKKNVDDIKRENFDNPKRQDEYGTSVISIQFTRGSNQLSIKNRYNHTVMNPDNTFNNNLDNIIRGLSSAFERDYGVRDKSSQSKSNLELDNYVNCNNKFYRYNYEIDNIYYCPNNIVIDNFKLIQLPVHTMLVDYFVFDFKNKTIKICSEELGTDAFVDCMTDIEKLDFSNNVITVTRKTGTTTIQINDDRRIIGFKDDSITEVDNDFLFFCNGLTYLEMTSLVVCGNCFLPSRNELKELRLPKLKKCGNKFLYNDEALTKLDLPQLKECGIAFLSRNERLSSIELPSLVKCGGWFLYCNKNLNYLYLPKLEQCGSEFLFYNQKLKDLLLPNLKKCDFSFLRENEELTTFIAPKLTEFTHGCFGKCKSLEDARVSKELAKFLIEYRNVDTSKITVQDNKSTKDNLSV